LILRGVYGKDMRKRKNWLPKKRVDVLVMANRWKVVLTIKALLWGIPDALVQELIQAIMEAQAALDAASPAIRTPVLTARVEAAFAKLEAAMRYMKDRYFKKPPLEDEDFISLGLVPKDTKPESHVLLALHYQGFDTVAIGWSVMPGDPEVDDDCRIEIGRRIMPHGGATLEQAAGPKHYLMKPPVSGEELDKLLDTTRAREPVSFDPEDGGMTAYFSARFVNSRNEAGPWGPIAAIIVPRADNPTGAGQPPAVP
jgi:hypothetical protein